VIVPRGRRPRFPQGLGRRLFVVVLISVTAAIALLTAAFNLVLDARLDADANDLLHARASSELQTLSVHNGRLALTEAPDEATGDTQVWVFAGTRVLEGPARVVPAIEREVRALIEGTPARRDIGSTSTRLLAVPVIDHGRRLGTVVEALSLAPYRQTRHDALIASLALAAVLLLAVAGAARWIVAAALRPVARMTAAAQDWSEHHPRRRFELGPVNDEITQLGATLDRLLDRIADSLARERRFSAEISHELRTPLARLLTEAQLALRGERAQSEYREALQRIVDSSRQLQRTLDTLVAAARAEAAQAPGSADANVVARAVADAAADNARRAGVSIAVTEADGPARVGAAPDLLERILIPIVENACRYGRSTVRVAVEREDSAVIRLDVIDDGPGVAAHERERIFEPAVRGSAAADGSGAGLGLALARRLARAAGGEIEAVPDSGGGRFQVRLPGRAGSGLRSSRGNRP
jgi:signal transduction histidine kinase